MERGINQSGMNIEAINQQVQRDSEQVAESSVRWIVSL